MASLKGNKLKQKIKALDTFILHWWIYVTVNVFLWLPWLTNSNTSLNSSPAYIGVIWGVVLVIHYIIAYRKFRIKKD
jgi:hypothetical protein